MGGVIGNADLLAGTTARPEGAQSVAKPSIGAIAPKGARCSRGPYTLGKIADRKVVLGAVERANGRRYQIAGLLRTTVLVRQRIATATRDGAVARAVGQLTDPHLGCRGYGLGAEQPQGAKPAFTVRAGATMRKAVIVSRATGGQTDVAWRAVIVLRARILTPNIAEAKGLPFAFR